MIVAHPVELFTRDNVVIGTIFNKRLFTANCNNYLGQTFNLHTRFACGVEFLV